MAHVIDPFSGATSCWLGPGSFSENVFMFTTKGVKHQHIDIGPAGVRVRPSWRDAEILSVHLPSQPQR